MSQSNETFSALINAVHGSEAFTYIKGNQSMYKKPLIDKPRFGYSKKRFDQIWARIVRKAGGFY